MAGTVIVSEELLFQIQRMEDDGAPLVDIDYRTDSPDVDPQPVVSKTASDLSRPGKDVSAQTEKKVA